MGDESPLVVIPMVAVFSAVLTALFGFDALAMLYFGINTLLAVAVELAVAWTAACTTMRIEREWWVAGCHSPERQTHAGRIGERGLAGRPD